MKGPTHRYTEAPLHLHEDLHIYGDVRGWVGWNSVAWYGQGK